MSSEEEDEELQPPCGLLQAVLLGSFETVHRESSTRVVHAVVLEQTNATEAAKRDAATSARKETMSQPSQPRDFIDQGDYGPSTSGGAGH
jgi:hypothetical protein